MRPRSSSGTITWSVVLDPAMKMMPEKPIMSRTAAATQKCWTADSETVPRPSTTAALTSTPSGGRPRPRPARVAAPPSAPRPTAAIRSPKPSASSWSTWRASRGTRTL